MKRINMEFILTLVPAAFIYGVGFLLILLLNAFLAGYHNTELTLFDLAEAALWPLTIVTFLGIIARALVRTIQSKFKG